MYDAFLMRGRERVAQRTGNFDDLLDGKATCGDQAVEWLPFDQLHRQEVDAVAFLHRVDGDDVRMVKLGESFGLTTKARESLRIVRHFGGQHLEGYVATEFRVGGAIHLTHATCAEGRKNFVGSQPSSGSQGHGVSNDCTLRKFEIQDRGCGSGLTTCEPLDKLSGLLGSAKLAH